jgi:hypothetical protein
MEVIKVQPKACPFSRGAIQRAVDRVSEAIQPHYEAIAEQARGAQVNYIDETAWCRHGVLAWLLSCGSWKWIYRQTPLRPARFTLPLRADTARCLVK